MLNIETSEYDFGKIIRISNDIDSFEILFGGNGDLYFRPVMNRIELFESQDPICFSINKDDGFLFETFEKLYNKICEYNPFDYNGVLLSESEKNYQKRRDFF